MSARTRNGWICGFCTNSTCASCTGAVINPGGKVKLLICGCDEHPKNPRCLDCGNTRAEELTGWACTNPTDCADAIAARSAANPLREELRIVRAMGGEARRRALAERTERQIRAAIAGRSIEGPDGKTLRLDGDCAADLTSGKRRPPRRAAGTCICGCGGVTKGGRFQPGHDMRLKSSLRQAIQAGGEQGEKARSRMIELGWEKFLPVAV